MIVLFFIILVISFSLYLNAIVDEFPWSEDFSEADLSTNWPLEEWDKAEGVLTENSDLVWGAFGWAPDDFANLTIPENICARINIYGTGRIHWLITPTFLLDEYSDYFLSFDYALTQYGNNNPANFGIDDRFCVVVSPDNGITWSSSDVVLEFNNSNDILNTTQNIEIPLEGYSGMIRFGLYGESLRSNEDVDFFVDNIQVTMTDFVPEPPQNLTYNIVESSVELNWNSPENNTPDSYRIYFNEDLYSTIDPADTTYTIDNFPIQETNVYVTAIYGEMESVPSNVVIINIVENSDDQIPVAKNILVFPNPVSMNNSRSYSSTTIAFDLSQDGFVKLCIYNTKGQKISTLLNKDLRKGKHKISWNCISKDNLNISSGIYFMRLDVNGRVQSKKITILP